MMNSRHENLFLLFVNAVYNNIREVLCFGLSVSYDAF